MTLAVVLVPSEPIDPIFISQCIAHCAHRGYTVAGLARDWPTAWKMVRDGLASVVTVARQEHINPDRLPRIEVCGEDTQALFRKAAGPEPVKNQRGRPHIIG